MFEHLCSRIYLVSLIFLEGDVRALMFENIPCITHSSFSKTNPRRSTPTHQQSKHQHSNTGTPAPGLCLPIAQIEYPPTFNCRMLTDQGKEPCEKPEKRKRIDCATSLFASTLAHCSEEGGKKGDAFKGRMCTGTYPDLSIRHGKGKFDNVSDPVIISGPKCRWSKVGDITPQPDRMTDGREWQADCGYGPKGDWIADLEGKNCKNDQVKFPGPKGKWHSTPSRTSGAPPGMWFALNNHEPDNDWTPGPDEAPTCPCNWQAKLWHLTKCNWKTCGPPLQGMFERSNHTHITKKNTSLEHRYTRRCTTICTTERTK